MRYQKANIYHLIAVFSIFIIQYTILNSQDTWIRTYQPFGDEEHYEVEDIRICPDGGYAVIGSIWNEWDGFRGFMMKTDSDGNFLWANFDIVEFVSEPEPSGFVVLEDGSFITAGNNFWGYGKYLLKRYPNGDIEWTQPLDNDFVIEAIELTNDGNLITTGSSMDDTINLQKLDLTGNLIWRGTYLPDEYEFGGGYSVTQTSDNGFALTGSVYGENNRDILVIKTDENGDSLWTWTYNGTANHNDKCNCVIENYDNEIVMGGYISNLVNRDYFSFLVKINSIGDTIWTKKVNGVTGISSFTKTQDNSYILQGGGDLTKINNDREIIWQVPRLVELNAMGDRSIFELNDQSLIYLGRQNFGSNISIVKCDSYGEVTSFEENEIVFSSHNNLLCYPNPINSTAKINFELIKTSHTEINLFNVKGQLVKNIENRFYQKGKHFCSINSLGLNSGVYIINLKSDSLIKSKKITILK